MPATKTLGNPQITGATIDEVRQSTQFWLRRVVDMLDQTMGLRGIPTFHGDVDFNQNRLMHLPLPLAPDDAVPLSEALTKNLDTSTQDESWNAEGLRIINLARGEDPLDSATIEQLRNAIDTLDLALIMGVLGVTHGGTGITSYAIGDLIYASAATVLSRLADVAIGSVLASGGVGAPPAYTAALLLAISLTTPDIYGSVSASGALTLHSTTHATLGKILFGTSAYDELNNRLGIGTQAPANQVHVYNATAGAVVRCESLLSSGAAFYRAFNDNGTRIQMFMNGSAAGGASLVLINDSGVLQSTGAGGLYIVASVSTAPIVFVTGGTATTNERGRIDNDGLAITHIRGATVAPTVASVAAGAGANATASIAGTDLAGLITLNTNVLDTPGANSDILTVTFNVAYAAAPIVVVTPSNDAAWNLAFAVVRCRQDDVTTTVFKLRSGAVPLPALTGATYTFKYIIVQ